tara:strand:- start:674 stop:892 length:219 start_codon:yes stop_codon:yes gene_type:complete
MKKDQPTNSNILSSQPPQNSFVVGDWDDVENFYAVLPHKNQLAIVYKAEVIKMCRTEDSARKFIAKHQRRRR